LDRGTVTLVDNQIDQNTGTIRLKAVFPNPQNKLWPGQFIDARVLVRMEKGALTIPSAAVQRGPDGMFAYVVKTDRTVEMRPLRVGEESGSVMIVQNGISEGERVVTSNHYRLQPGAHVKVAHEAPNQELVGKTGR
jgi:multidrug efflux system membrane fusion protein